MDPLRLVPVILAGMGPCRLIEQGMVFPRVRRANVSILKKILHLLNFPAESSTSCAGTTSLQAADWKKRQVGGRNRRKIQPG